MSDDAIVLAAYSGLDPVMDTGVWLSWAMLAMTVIITGGLVFFGTKWRYLFLGYMALTQFVVVPLSGMNVETGLSIALRDLLNILVGALITLILVEEIRGSKAHSDPAIDR